MAAILNSVMLDSDTAILYRDNLFSSLRFTQKHSHSTLSLTQTNSIWLKLSHPSFSSQTHSHLPRLVPNICTKKNFTHSFWLNLMMAAILNSSILISAILDSAILHKKKLHSFILTQLDDSSHLEFCRFAFSHLSFPSQTHSHLPRLIPTICTKKLHSFILTQLDDGSHPVLCHVGCRHWHLGFRHLVIFSQIHSKTLSIQSDSDSISFFLTYLDDGNHLEFCHLEFGHLGFSPLSFSSQSHSHFSRLVPTI